MERRTILIAETNKPQDNFIKNALIRNNIDIDILKSNPLNSKEMKEAIIELKPNIVITNEKKGDKPATDIIREIQSDKAIKQPIFILVSGYAKDEIKYLLENKNIIAYSISKPYNYDRLANYIKTIINEVWIRKRDFDSTYNINKLIIMYCLIVLFMI